MATMLPRVRLSMPSVVLLGCLAVASVDAGGSLVANALAIPYGWFALVSLTIYAVVGAAAAHDRSLAAAAVAGFGVAMFDITAGWWISWQLGPGRVPIATPADRIAMAVGAVVVVAGETAVAVLAGMLSKRKSFARPPK